jgi:hypothetical protein
MKSLVLASAFAAALAVGAFSVPSAAEARTSIGIYFGFPHYDHRVGPGYVYRDGYGWYYPRQGYFRGRLSCGEARRVVRNHGYRNVDAVECQGRTYTFEGTRRGREVVIYVNSRTGRIWRG